MLRNFDELLEGAKAKGKKRIVVSGGDDPVAIEALKRASEAGLIDALLVGEREKLEALGSPFRIENAVPEEIPLKAARLVSDGQADIIMKGKISTSAFLKGILDESVNLRTDRRMSHIAVMESKFYHKLFFITDGGMNIMPDLSAKSDILMNAVDFAHRIGIECPKVAVLAAVEKVNPDIPETVDAQKLSEMASTGKFGKCKVEGPLALDLAVSKDACEIKGIKSEVGGDADILLVPDIASGNISAKSLLWLGGAKIGGIVVGAKIPCIMLSRADDKEIKLNSIALGVISS